MALNVKFIQKNFKMTSSFSTPSRSRNKTPPASDNVEQEFSKRFMQLFTSFYETPGGGGSAEALLNFPPVVTKKSEKYEGSKQNIAPPPFNAAVWDLRLKKAIDARQTTDQQTSEALTENTIHVPEMKNPAKKQLSSNNNNNGNNNNSVESLAEVFQPEKVERPEVPKYLQTIEKEQNEEVKQRKNRKKPKSLNLTEVEKQYQIRQKKQKQRDLEHQKKLRDWKLEKEKSHREFLNSLPKSKFSSIDKENNSKTETKSRSKSPAPPKTKQSASATLFGTEINYLSPKNRSKSPGRPVRSPELFTSSDE